MISGNAKIAAIIGNPVGHSLSPMIHRYWLDCYKIDGAYVPFKIEGADVATVLDAMQRMGFVGCNVTVPHKEAVAAIVANKTDAAKQIGAVNTLIRGANGEWIGDNTDGYGFYHNLKTHYPQKTAALKTAMMIGAGGAARAIIVALQKAGVEKIKVVNRTQDRAKALAKDVDKIHVVAWSDAEKAMASCDVIINTTSLGMAGQPDLELSLEHAPAHAIIADIVYRPLMTPWLVQAQSRGFEVLTGIGMLLHQAVPGFEAWFGVRPEVSPALQAHVLEQLKA